jgi:hypothetical protein
LTWNTFRDHMILEYEIPKYDGDLGAPNTFVPLTRRAVDAKVSHVMEHFPSQAARAWFSPEVSSPSCDSGGWNVHRRPASPRRFTRARPSSWGPDVPDEVTDTAPPPVQVIPLRRIPDERGTIFHMLRATDPHFLQFGRSTSRRSTPESSRAGTDTVR